MVKQRLCMFQMMRAEDGSRSEPFTMTVEKLARHFGSLEKLDDVKDDYVLVLMEFGTLDETVTDYSAIAKNGSFSSAPAMTVSTFVSLFNG